MPELPEVETVKRGLAPVMEGALLETLELRRADLRFPFPAGFAQQVASQTISRLSRRAKYLLIELENGWTVISHLGMSGSFRIEDAGAAATVPGDFHYARSKNEKHDHAVFHLKRGAQQWRVIYNDPRRFGFMDIVKHTELNTHPFFSALGPEPVDHALDAPSLARRFKGKAQPLKSALLDQRNIAGLGNIYVCEALWRSHLSPHRAAGSLVDADGQPTQGLEQLVQSICDVIKDAIKAGGSSLRDHIQTDGSMGYFQHSFSVYDREGHACPMPDCAGIVERSVQAGRSSFYCAVCQV